MKPYLLQMLKELALLGALNERIELSSKELAIQLGTSQQTASRYLLELDKLGMVTRELGVKKQMIRITEQGAEVLRDEYAQYQRIFEFPQRVYFNGRIVSGMGEGRYYTEREGYVNQFKDKLGFKPYPGTLNVEIKQIDKNKIRILRKIDAIEIQPFETEDRTFGGVKCYPATINNYECIMVLPARGHYSTVLEFISPVCLRDKLHLKDGDSVEVVVSPPGRGDGDEE
ncbi:MAG TPA: DUF120 domain-containing protein [Thermoplasmatales archaeon]|nr:DUF120 domain-containing protein [Thermoplasmatales archaeon]